MRRQLVTAIALAFTAASTVSAQTCPNSIAARYPVTTIRTRTVYLPTQVEQIQFGSQQHLSEFAAALYEQSNTICWEMHHNYQGNVDFHETYAEMYKIMQDTKHVFDLVRRNTTLGDDDDHIAADLHEMDALFHHIEDDVARWRPSRRSHYHARIGLGGKMEQFEETLHHLMEDYGVNSRIGVEAPAPLQTLQAPAPTVPLPSNTYQSPNLPLDGVNPGTVVQPIYRNSTGR